MKRLSLILTLCLVSVLSFAQKDTLRISILGDSYSTYEGYLTPDTNSIWYYRPENKEHHAKNDVKNVEETWWYQVIDRMGGKLEINNSYSGATICCTGYKKDKKDKDHQDYTDRAFITRSNKLGNPDVIFVCGGTNDSWAGSPIGEYTYGNWTKQELYSYRPALAKLLYDLKGNYPTARIYFILNSELRSEINESTHTICKHYAIPCIDLKDIEKQWGHPSVKGMKAFADQVISQLGVRN